MMAGIGLLILVGLYFTPLIVALIRKVPNTGSVAVINVFLGWSIIGWIVSLAMASRSVPKPQQIIVTHVATSNRAEAIETLKNL
ncbi:MAG: superinfection immunity protein [Isosphaeraceae bacterium]